MLTRSAVPLLGAMVARVFDSRHQLKVGVAVVGAITVLVVYGLVGMQSPTKDSFHHETVLKHVPIVRVGMTARPHPNVPLDREVTSTLPVRTGGAAQLRGMAAQERHREAREVSPIDLAPCGCGIDQRPLAAPALTEASGDEVRRRRFSLTVPSNERARIAGELSQPAFRPPAQRHDLGPLPTATLAQTRGHFVGRRNVPRSAYRVAPHVVAAKETRTRWRAAPTLASVHVRQYTLPEGA